jgi:hypothetical protein
MTYIKDLKPSELRELLRLLEMSKKYAGLTHACECGKEIPLSPVELFIMRVQVSRRWTPESESPRPSLFNPKYTEGSCQHCGTRVTRTNNQKIFTCFTCRIQQKRYTAWKYKLYTKSKRQTLESVV